MPSPGGPLDDLPPGVTAGGRFGDWTRTRVRYVVADMDGTLVGPASLPRPAVVESATRLMADGVPLGVATGRMLLGARPTIERLAATGPHVLCNGAQLADTDATIRTWPIGGDAFGALLELARERDAYLELYTPEEMFVTVADERARPHWDLLGLRSTPRTVDALLDPNGAPTLPVLKGTFGVFDGASWDDLADASARIGLSPGPGGSPLTPSIYYVNVNDGAVDKGTALAAAAAHVDAPIESVMAIGDAPNDRALMTTAGTAIAMGNADASIKALAHLVVPSVDDDGAAVAFDLARSLTARA